MSSNLTPTETPDTYVMNFLDYKARDAKAVFSANTLTIDAVVRTFIAETDHFTASLVYDDQAKVPHYKRTGADQ